MPNCLHNKTIYYVQRNKLVFYYKSDTPILVITSLQNIVDGKKFLLSSFLILLCSSFIVHYTQLPKYQSITFYKIRDSILSLPHIFGQLVCTYTNPSNALMPFISNISNYLPILYWLGLCPFTVNRKLNQIIQSPSHKVLYAIVASTILTLSSVYMTIYRYDYLGRPSTTNILLISELINMITLRISCALVIGSAIMKSQNSAKLFMFIETLDDQIDRKTIGLLLVGRTETNCFITVILPTFTYFGWQLFAGCYWLYKVNAITIGFALLFAMESSILTLSMLHVRYLCMELLSQLNKIQQIGHEIRDNYPSNNDRSIYQKLSGVVELLDMFDDAKFMLNENIGWLLIGNYVSDFVYMALSFFVLLMYAGVMPKHRLGHRFQALEIFIVYAMPYGLKVVRSVQAISKIGARHQVGPILFLTLLICQDESTMIKNTEYFVGRR